MVTGEVILLFMFLIPLAIIAVLVNGIAQRARRQSAEIETEQLQALQARVAALEDALVSRSQRIHRLVSLNKAMMERNG